MSNPTLTDAFTLTRDNLTALTQAALPDMTEVLAYVDVIPNAYPLTQFYFGKVRYQRESSTTQTFSTSMEMDITVAEFKQGYDGQAQQMAQFTYLPTFLQYFYEHSSLTYNGVGIPFLDIINSGVQDAGVEVRNNRLMIVLNWTLIYRTGFVKC